ncbi:hypothetical protein [Actinokineospora iranica]|uniref:Uncharacterized protein n=1 Tax=Actinokineospora iranica TaxID=1271860 RepID=A0A1G6PZC0_9PSEU|nr:hypothetical protein [Actinokineospora iranica]SDC85552.1 hypothetical protein SAMN05216174_1059 [Actinokineospora iranica]
MAGSDGVIERLEQSFNGLDDKVREAINRYDAGVHNVRAWKYALAPVMFAICEGFDTIRDGLDKLVKLVRTAVEHHMPVVSLIVQSFNWLESVKDPVNGLSHKEKNIAQQWEGEASAAYQTRVTEQNNAINAYAVRAEGVSKWLMDIAKYNIEYMTELAKMATSFLGALATAAVEAATVIGIPFAVSDLAGAIGNFVTQSLDNLVGIAKRYADALSRVRDLKSIMTGPEFPDGKWPQAIAG